MGPSPVLQYRPLKPTALGACSDSVLVVTTTAVLPPPPTTATCLPADTCRTCSRHPCAALLASARTLASCARDSCVATATLRRCCRPTAADQPPPPLHAPHMQPPPVHLTPSLLVWRRSHSLLFPQLSSSSHHSARPRHRHLSPAIVDCHLRCSSGPIDPTCSITRAWRCSPTSPTKPATAGRPPPLFPRLGPNAQGNWAA
jgi:hypothetical protein